MPRSDVKDLSPSRIGGFALLVIGALAVLLAPAPVAAVGAIAVVVAAALVPLPALGLIVVSLPFYLLDRHLGHWEFSPTEIFIVLTAVGSVLRLGWAFAAPEPQAAARPLVVVGLASGKPAKRASGGYTPSLWERVRERALARPGKGVDPCIFAGIRQLVGDPALAGLVVLLVLAGLVSLTASVALHDSLRSFRTIIVEPAIFYFLVVTRIRDRRGAFVLALALVLAGVAISCVGFWQYATDQNIITAEDQLRRIRGFYGSPNNLGLFLGRALPMAVALGLWWVRGRVLLLSAAAIMAVALLLTFSIGAWVGVAAGLLAIAALRGRQTLKVAVGIGVAGLIIVAIAALRIPRIGSHVNLHRGTDFERLLIWQSSLRMLAGHAVRGIGLDNFLYYYQHGYRLPAGWREPDLSHPHNLILDFWLSLGLPGILLLGLLLGRLVEVVVARWKAASLAERGAYAGVVGAMVDTVVHGLVDNSFFLVDLSVLFWLMFAIVAVLARQANE